MNIKDTKEGAELIWQLNKVGDYNANKELWDAYYKIEELLENLSVPVVVNCVYVVTERDNYGEQLFKGVFANREKAIDYLTEDGLKESNIDEINEVELD